MATENKSQWDIESKLQVTVGEAGLGVWGRCCGPGWSVTRRRGSR